MDTRRVLLALAICGYVGCWYTPLAGDNAGNEPDVPPAIIGGTDAAEDAWPWQVLLLHKKRFICSGTILNAKTVLTAAHCTVRFKHYRIKVVVGEYNRDKNEWRSRREKKMGVKQIIEHPDYIDGYFPNDMSIIKLWRSVSFNDYIQPIPALAEDDMDLMNSTCFVTGWGVDKDLTSAATILQELQVPVVRNVDCGPKLTRNVTIPDDMICTDAVPKGACYGDSGGPLQCSVNGEWVHAGTVSWGNRNCSTGPTVYSRTSYFRDWILANM